MAKDLTTQELKQIINDPKFAPFIGEYLYRRDNKEEAVVKLNKNIVLLESIPDKDVIKYSSVNAVEHVFIESENLYALAALGNLHDKDKFDVVLIDPLYGTQGGDFRYSDKIIDKDDPQGMLKWSMSIENRLILAKNLMKPDSIIMAFENFENCHLLRNVMDKIFGRENVIAHRPWKKKAVPGPQIKGFQDHVDYICVYSMNKSNLKMRSFQLEKSAKIMKRYKWENETGIYEIYPLEKSGSKHATRPTKYDVIAPDGSIVKPMTQWWSWSEENYKEHGEEFIIFKWRIKGSEKGTRWHQSLDPTGKFHVPYSEEDLDEISEADVEWKPFVKSYYKVADGEVRMSTPSCIIDEESIQSLIEDKSTLNADANTDAEEYIGKSVTAMSPKPVELIKKLIKEVNKKDIRIIDFYGGLATTVQATIELNQEDGQKRVCYYVQNEEGLDERDNQRIIDDALLRIKNLMDSTEKNENSVRNGEINLSGISDEEYYSTQFKQNLRYYKTRLIPIDFDNILDEECVSIFEQSDDIIKLIEESYEVVIKRDMYSIYKSKNRVIVIANEQWDENDHGEEILDKDFEDNNLSSYAKILYKLSFNSDEICEDGFTEMHPVPYNFIESQEKIKRSVT